MAKGSENLEKFYFFHQNYNSNKLDSTSILTPRCLGVSDLLHFEASKACCSKETSQLVSCRSGTSRNRKKNRVLTQKDTVTLPHSKKLTNICIKCTVVFTSTSSGYIRQGHRSQNQPNHYKTLEIYENF